MFSIFILNGVNFNGIMKKGKEIEKPTITGTRKIEKPNAFKKEDGSPYYILGSFVILFDSVCLLYVCRLILTILI